MNFDGDMILVDREQTWYSEIYFITWLHCSDPRMARSLNIYPPHPFVILSASEGSPNNIATNFQLEVSVKYKAPGADFLGQIDSKINKM